MNGFSRVLSIVILVSLPAIAILHAETPAVSVESKPKSSATKRPSVSELLDKYAANQEKIQSFIIKTIQSNVGKGKRVFSNEIRYDGKRCCVRSYGWGRISAIFHATKEKPHYWSRLWDGEKFFQYEYQTGKDSGKVIITPEKFKNDLKKIKSVLRMKSSDTVLMGRMLDGDRDRLDIHLRKSKSITVRSKMEKVGGSHCYVIYAMTERGKYTLWIDPEHGYNIAKAVVVRGPGDVVFDGYTIKKGEKISLFLNKIRFQRIDGVWVPMEAEVVNSRIWPPKAPYKDYKYKFHLKRTDVILNPDHEALGSFLPDDIQNGARVILKGDTKTRRTWQDGEVVDENGRKVDYKAKGKRATKRRKK